MNASLCQGAWLVGFRVQSRRVVGKAREWLARRAGFLGCDPAALVSEPFPYCPPGSLTWAGARRASVRRRAKAASLIWRLSERRASLCVLPSASFLSK